MNCLQQRALFCIISCIICEKFKSLRLGWKEWSQNKCEPFNVISEWFLIFFLLQQKHRKVPQICMQANYKFPGNVVWQWHFRGCGLIYFPLLGASRFQRLSVPRICPWHLWGGGLFSLSSSEPGCYPGSVCALLHPSRAVGENKQEPDVITPRPRPPSTPRLHFPKLYTEPEYKISRV